MDPYEEYMATQYGGYKPPVAAAPSLASAASPWLQGAGLLSSAFGTLLQSQQADRNYELELRKWKEEQQRQTRMDAANAAQLQTQNGLSAGQYSRSLSGDIEDPYIKYAKALGL
jgi:hypothetical protein